MTKDDILSIISAAEKLCQFIEQFGFAPAFLQGKCLAMVFDETSLRTRSAFERAMFDLGGYALHYRGEEVRVGRHAAKHEHLSDLVNVMGRFNDAILSRIYDHKIQTKIAELSPVPFINGMCDLHHPTQALCDILTIHRRFNRIEGLKIAFVGDGTNVARSIAQSCGLLGATFAIATPEGFELQLAPTSDLNSFVATNDPIEAVADADVVVTDVWVPMNGDSEPETRRRCLEKYQVNSSLMAAAKPHAIFLHNLPANRGDEVTEDVIDGPQSVVYDEAVARLHIARGLLLLMLREDWERCLSFLDCEAARLAEGRSTLVVSERLGRHRTATGSE